MLVGSKKNVFGNKLINCQWLKNLYAFVFHKKKYGQSTMEYMLLITLMIGALLVVHKYIVRGMWGQWKDVGDSFGSGRIYDPE